MGSNQYMLSKQAATGFSGTGAIKADALQEAAATCGGQGKTTEIVSLTESQPPYVFGNYPKVDVQFTCTE